MTVNVSRRALFAATGGLTLAAAVPVREARGQMPDRARRVSAYLTIRPDGAILLRNPFIEGGQGIDTGIAQIIAEELDADPARFIVSAAPPGEDYLLLAGNRMRFTGGSFSVRSSFEHFRRLGATARAMLMQAAAGEWGVALAELRTEPGAVLHAASARRADYGALAHRAATLTPPGAVTLKDPARFRVIGTSVPRLEARAKSTGALRYTIDETMEGMEQAAIRHAPRAGMVPGAIANAEAVRAMPGVTGLHVLPGGAIAVTADRWWRAKKAVDAVDLAWAETPEAVPAGFTHATRLAELRIASAQPGEAAESAGDVETALGRASMLLEAEYDAPYLAHAQLEPPSALAWFRADGILEIRVPNQAPDLFRAAAATAANLPAERVEIHSPPLGGFFGRHFIYPHASPMPQAIALARSAGKPVKVIWSREEEFLRDAYRPLSHARFRGGLDSQGNLVALDIRAAGEGPSWRNFGRRAAFDSSVTEGLAGKPYRIPHRRVGHVASPHPARVGVGFWRAVGHSMNDTFFECFLDELADRAGRDPFMFRQALLQHSPRHLNLMQALADLAGRPWRMGGFDAPGGGRRARGMALATSFGTETATLAEVSLEGKAVRVHQLWVAIDPGRVVNPEMVRRQVEGAAALGLSAALHEEVAFEAGSPVPRNFDTYPMLRCDEMPAVHVAIVESGAAIGGVGEPGLPGVPPAVLNAVAALTGQRIRSLPLAKARLAAGRPG